MILIYVVKNLDNGLKFDMSIDYTKIYHMYFGFLMKLIFWLFYRFFQKVSFENFGPKTQNFEEKIR